MIRTSRLAPWLLLVPTAMLVGCASGAWRAALKEDAPAAYYRFLRDHPGSKYAPRAEARLEYHKVRRRPTLSGLRAFRDTYPGEAELLEKLRPLLEEKAFDLARAEGSAEAYASFLEEFPAGGFAERALGNRVYLENDGFDADPVALGRFAEEHPASDFAAEAARSAGAHEVREATRFQRVSLAVQIAPGTPDAARLEAEFVKRATEMYRAVGITLEPPGALRTASPNEAPMAHLSIFHSEELTQTSLDGGEFTRPGVLATTRVTLRLSQDGPPIWERDLQLRAERFARLSENSILFAPNSERYWEGFFVPVASWQTNAALRSVLRLGKEITAVDSGHDRGVVLYEDGDFQVIALEDPTEPVVLAQYTRPQDFTTWSGVRALGDRIAIFGNDGFELVTLASEGSERVLAHDRSTIGAVSAVEPFGEGLLIAGNRGLMVAGADGSTPMRVLRRNLRGLAVAGDLLLLADGESLILATLPLLRQNRVLAQLRLGRDFAPGRIRAFGDRAVVLGERGALVIDVSDPRDPKLLSRLSGEAVGRIEDAGRAADRIFLLGERGLLVVQPDGRTVRESVDLAARTGLVPMGRHLLAVGGSELQVVDATPFGGVAGDGRAAASPAP